MAIHPEAAVRNAITDLVVGKLNDGTGTTEGRVLLKTGAQATVATLLMSNPAFGASAAGIATANAITDDTNAAGGIAVTADLVDRDGLIIMTVTVGTGAEELTLTDNDITIGDTVQLGPLTYAAPT